MRAQRAVVCVAALAATFSVAGATRSEPDRQGLQGDLQGGVVVTRLGSGHVGGLGQASILYRSHYLAAGVALDHVVFPWEQSTGTTNFESTGLMATARVLPVATGRWDPHVSLGIGRHTLDGDLARGSCSIGDGGLLLSVGGGVDYFVTDWLSAGLRIASSLRTYSTQCSAGRADERNPNPFIASLLGATATF